MMPESISERQTGLPIANDLGFYEMRLESVGGLGANLAGQVLAEALVLGQGFNGAHFSSYGSEKKGSPVKSHVRVCPSDRDVRTSSPVERPHLLAIFHHCLLKINGTLSGIYPESVIVISSPDSVEDVRKQAQLASGTLAVIDALLIAVEHKTRINAALLGAITRASGFIDPEAVKKSLTAAFAGRKELIDANIGAFDHAYEDVKIKHYARDGKFPEEGYERTEPESGYRTMPLGGIILEPGNTMRKDLSASRQGIYPMYHRNRCIDCGLCTQTCPDYVFVWERGLNRTGKPDMVMKGPNYQYCKGCLKCVEICPVEALTMECERPEFKYTADVQLWGPPDALVTMGRENDPAKWPQGDGYYWYRVS